MGVSVWLTIAVINNLMDPVTNISMISQMMRMDTPSRMRRTWVRS